MTKGQAKGTSQNTLKQQGLVQKLSTYFSVWCSLAEEHKKTNKKKKPYGTCFHLNSKHYRDL